MPGLAPLARQGHEQTEIARPREHAGIRWRACALLLDGFGGVMHITAHPRLGDAAAWPSHHGQVIVVTQSAADPEALTGQRGLLACSPTTSPGS